MPFVNIANNLFEKEGNKETNTNKKGNKDTKENGK